MNNITNIEGDKDKNKGVSMQNHGIILEAQDMEIQRMSSNRRMFRWVAILCVIPMLALFGGTSVYFISHGQKRDLMNPLRYLGVFNFGRLDVPSDPASDDTHDSTNYFQMSHSKMDLEFDDYEEDVEDEFERSKMKQLMSRSEFTNYENALRVRASRDKVILIKMLNEKAADMAINFSEEILTKKDYENYLFVSMEKGVCDSLRDVELPCYVHDEYEGGQVTRDQLVDYLRPGKAMTLLRVRMILDAIKLGYTVLFTGANTLYLKDPFGVMESTCDKCDVTVSIEPDESPYANWATHYVKPTRSSVLLYSKILLDLKKQISDSDTVLNEQLNDLHDKVGLKVAALDSSKFIPSSEYFKKARFANDKHCGPCVAIYEDRKISKPEQVYEFKEMGIWRANFDEYYSSRRRSYIRYYHPYNFGSSTRALLNEIIALRNALMLGQILDKIIILPRFHCPEGLAVESFCSLRDILKLSAFDEQFEGLYREHSFPDHPEVSREVKRQVSDVYFLGNKKPPKPDKDSELRENQRLVYLNPEDTGKGATPDELKEFFSREWRYFLRIHSLYGGLKGFDSKEETDNFNRKIMKGFVFKPSIQEEIDNHKLNLEVEHVK